MDASAPTPSAPRPSSPLRDRHERVVADIVSRRNHSDGTDRPGAAVGRVRPGELEMLPYGPVREQGGPLELVALYDSVEIEYAAIRRAAALLDASHRGTIIVTGAERLEFLNRMVTQQVGDLLPGVARSAFWLNRKGRIDADLLIVDLPVRDGEEPRLWIDLDRHVAASTATALETFVFGEAVAFRDRTESFHRLALHGSRALEALARVASADDGATIAAMADRTAVGAAIGDRPVMLVRRDQCGEVGVEISCAVDDAIAIWDALREVDWVRPIGWHAYNIARIEAGTPLFNIDFDTTSLPHETGILRDRVSFTKGCYLGQEVVARMESLGKPKQTLVGLRIESTRGVDVLPECGSTVCLIDGDDDAIAAEGTDAESNIGAAIGTITSSTLSPMLGAAPIALAMIRTKHAELGRKLLVFGGGARAIATVAPLRAWGATTGGVK